MTNACVVLDLPYFYIIGGRTITGLTYDFWQYNFTNNQFYLRRSTDLNTDIPLFKHTCFLSIENDNKYVYVFFGSQSIDDNPYCGITRFNITDLTQVTTEIISTSVTEFTCRTESGTTFFGGYLFGFGGQSFAKNVFYDLFMISIDSYEETVLAENFYKNYPDYYQPIYSSAFAQYGEFFFTFSGLNTAYFPQIKPLNTINLYSFQIKGQICGNGFLYNNASSKCSGCPLGTYSGINDNECKDCEKEFFSNFSAASDITQCFPCPEGTFSNITGLAECFKCESFQYCPIGSKKNIKFTKFIDDSYPKIYQPQSNDEYKSIYFYGFIVFIVFYLIL